MYTLNKTTKKFIKKDFPIFFTILFIILSLASGSSIAFSIQYLGGGFRFDNIYAMYAYIAQLPLLIFPVLLWGSEYENQTMDLIKGSKVKMCFLFFVKFLTYTLVCILISLSLILFLFAYDKFYNVGEMNFNIILDIMLSYVLYGLFLFSLGSLVSILVKKVAYSIIILMSLKIFLPVVCMGISQINEFTDKVISYFPYSFIEDSFSFAKFTSGQIVSTIIFSIILGFIAFKSLEEN